MTRALQARHKQTLPKKGRSTPTRHLTGQRWSGNVAPRLLKGLEAWQARVCAQAGLPSTRSRFKDLGFVILDGGEGGWADMFAAASGQQLKKHHAVVDYRSRYELDAGFTALLSAATAPLTLALLGAEWGSKEVRTHAELVISSSKSLPQKEHCDFKDEGLVIVIADETERGTRVWPRSHGDLEKLTGPLAWELPLLKRGSVLVFDAALYHSGQPTKELRPAFYLSRQIVGTEGAGELNRRMQRRHKKMRELLGGEKFSVGDFDKAVYGVEAQTLDKAGEGAFVRVQGGVKK